MKWLRVVPVFLLTIALLFTGVGCDEDLLNFGDDDSTDTVITGEDLSSLQLEAIAVDYFAQMTINTAAVSRHVSLMLASLRATDFSEINTEALPDATEAGWYWFPDSAFWPDSVFFPDSAFWPDSVFFPDSAFLPSLASEDGNWLPGGGMTNLAAWSSDPGEEFYSAFDVGIQVQPNTVAGEPGPVTSFAMEVVPEPSGFSGDIFGGVSWQAATSGDSSDAYSPTEGSLTVELSNPLAGNSLPASMSWSDASADTTIDASFGTLSFENLVLFSEGELTNPLSNVLEIQLAGSGSIEGGFLGTVTGSIGGEDYITVVFEGLSARNNTITGYWTTAADDHEEQHPFDLAFPDSAF